MDPTPNKPALTPQAEARKLERAAREAAALRENLRRRKQQARDRQDAPAPPVPPDDARP